ncbi:MAG: right-handed parallel beta-helix repeat-containing protein, partial [Desulfobacterales bacterium]|nr:right-handed parallel beta-helix repeat-containing protein [Desulfobacterales bacterium]
MKTYKQIIIILMICCLPLPVHAAADFYVNGAVSASGAGTSWNTAFKTIQEGIDAASGTGGGEVWVAKSTYYIYETSSSDAVELTNGVHLYGGFAGTETSREDRDWNTNTTTIDGHQYSGSSNQVKHVVTAFEDSTVSGYTATFDGFTVTGGSSSMGSPPKRKLRRRATSPEEIFSTNGDGSGGGMLIWRCNPTVANSIFTGNTAGKAGGVYVMVATEFPSGSPNPAPTFTDCTFSNNSASARGGGQMNDVASHPTFIRCRFTDNTCDAKGGGMYNDFGCSPTLINCLFAENTAERASAMGADGTSSPKLVNCTVTNNYANDVGAGLYTGSYLGFPNEPTLVNCIVWGNFNQWGGPQDFNVWHENHFYISYSFIGNGFTSKDEGVIQDKEYTSDPMFVDPDNGDYRLQSTSPCVDTGTTSDSDVPENDIDGNTRDSMADMGAFETQAGAETGSLTVVLEPTDAVTAGAKWQVDSGSWQSSGATVSSLSVGTHTVSFKTVSGWTAPSDKTVTVSSGQTASATGTYTEIVQQTGSLEVTLSPSGAVSAGAQWQIDSGSWQSSGATVSDLSVGTHTVSFKTVSGWTAPSDKTVTVSSGQTASTTGTYTEIVQQTGSLKVTLSPSDAVSAGAQWQVDSGSWQSSGATVSSLSVGTHTVSFKTVSGWTAPSDQTVNIVAGQTGNITGTYTEEQQSDN